MNKNITKLLLITCMLFLGLFLNGTKINAEENSMNSANLGRRP